jgi:lia operon protein LiaF|tara:strand:- start:3114 stop:3284 length:171 start_codon:yes stop_codon:yes gene_type:complete
MNKSIGVSLFLIVIGSLFLLDNLDVIDISITELIRDYWPVILIWMGIEKLVRDFKS